MSDFIRNLRGRALEHWYAWRERRQAEGLRPVSGSREGHHRNRRVAIAVVVLLALYYPVGMLIYNRIDDDTSFQPSAEFVVPGGSKAVSTVVALVSREA